MLFSSLTFLSFFLPLFLLLYFLVPGIKAKNGVLFVMSIFFYAWGEPVYVFLMLLILGINYFAAILIGSSLKRKKGWLILALCVDVLTLIFYKYAAFLIRSAEALAGIGLSAPDIVLPIGISFYMFQIIAYLVDVYRGKTPPLSDFVALGAFLAAFPQLIAGPIVRYTDIEKELTERKQSASDIEQGAMRFIVGLSKKVLIANRMAAVADALFAVAPDRLGFLGAWIAAFSYTLQIYYDFSGYSDMAIGLGRIMGFHYPENFDHPYAAKSIGDFWRRWHMTLTAFFREYVYIPLGGNRVSRFRWAGNMLFVWCLTGIWHGAGFNFICWGLYYGLLLLAERLLFPKFSEKHPFFSHAATMILVTTGWILFRSDSLRNAYFMLKGMTGLFGFVPEHFAGTLLKAGFGTVYAAAALAGVFFSIPHPTLSRGALSFGKGVPLKAGLIILLLLDYASLASGAYNPFIYFRF